MIEKVIKMFLGKRFDGLFAAVRLLIENPVQRLGATGAGEVTQ